MLVSWQWLSDFVRLTVSPEDLARRFAMSGLNHEQTTQVDDDTVIDLEVTSNRGDCLGHIGVAREASVLLGQPLCVPEPTCPPATSSSNPTIGLDNQFPAACSRYMARVIRGVRVGPSPAWLVKRLRVIGINSVNNVVDVTNYVMMECGQPLHAFDLGQIRGGRIIVRPARPGEKFMAIDHRTYELDQQMVVIADADRAVALGGVMGGADSEISSTTTDLLIETALFEPLSIRRTARKLKLMSPSSFRFERRPDPAGIDWASRRCCELILQVAGGSLESGVASVGQSPNRPAPIPLRLAQIPRILGIDVEQARVRAILEALGCHLAAGAADRLEVVPPSWRSDLTREADLIEEVARIHGYDQIPENVAVPMAVARPRRKDLAVERLRHTLSAYGIDEAMTPSVVSEPLEAWGSPWTEQSPLATETPLLEGARLLRRSLLPSLLAARQYNQSLAMRHAQLYEIANIVVPQADVNLLPLEQSTLGIVTDGEDLRLVRGIVEAVFEQLGAAGQVQWTPTNHPLFGPGAALAVHHQDRLMGRVGLVAPQVLRQLGLGTPCGAAELNVDALTELLTEVRRASLHSSFPAVGRDLNFIVDEGRQWAELEAVCRQHAGPDLRRVEYREIYRDPQKDGANMKRMLLTLEFQSMQRTLTGEEVDQCVAAVVAACQQQLAARLLA